MNLVSNWIRGEHKLWKETLLSHPWILIFQIQEKVETLESEREKLLCAWNEERDHLDEMFKQQVFYRDANQLDTISQSQEVRPIRYYLFVLVLRCSCYLVTEGCGGIWWILIIVKRL
jgi:hypothetical protein